MARDARAPHDTTFCHLRRPREWSISTRLPSRKARSPLRCLGRIHVSKIALRPKNFATPTALNSCGGHQRYDRRQHDSGRLVGPRLTDEAAAHTATEDGVDLFGVVADSAGNALGALSVLVGDLNGDGKLDFEMQKTLRLRFERLLALRLRISAKKKAGPLFSQTCPARRRRPLQVACDVGGANLATASSMPVLNHSMLARKAVLYKRTDPFSCRN